jgi:hypothetical protein
VRSFSAPRRAVVVTSGGPLAAVKGKMGFDSNKYFAWEIGMEKKFGQRRICERRKLRHVASAYLTNNALSWWKLTIRQIFTQARGPVAALAHKAGCGPM